ncbi:hypothetical protein HPB49_004895 [Dermacentor silvarum]|uniref:Uncharacterized protein n=1 Tax=Dermacentor silvarum TaxID=543639 RepID=A0ACB8C268_DERSI|nr:hypothetical protein HPB49_004895 [Dermacentor silvarum]
MRRISPAVLCNVVSVTSRDVNAPADRYRRCAQRVNVTASSLFASEAASPDKFPRDQKYRAAVQLFGGSKEDINSNPEVLALMDAYRVLNNTVSVTDAGGYTELLDKSIDMVLLPVTMPTMVVNEVFAAAYYSPNAKELQPHLETCAMAPCLNAVWDDILISGAESGFSPIFPLIFKLAFGCADTYYTFGSISPCYAKAQAGSHVVLSTCSDQEVSAASQWGLAASNDLFTFPQMFILHWQNPVRLQHRRILFAITEHGLAVPHRRRVLPQMSDEDLGAESFDLYFGVYLAGCVLSCAALAAELLCSLKHRRRVGDNL